MKIKPMLGDFALDGIEFVESYESRALVEHRVPGLAGNYFQDMGVVPNTIIIAGTKTGDDDRDTFLTGIRKLFNQGDPVSFAADIDTATDITDVIIEDFRAGEIAGSTDTFEYFIRLRKYVPPPQPPATGLLGDDILGDALGALGAMDVLDGLVPIPSLADPSTPLKGAMDSVKSATSGLSGATAPLKKIFGGA
jgi:hypothetical protein